MATVTSASPPTPPVPEEGSDEERPEDFAEGLWSVSIDPPIESVDSNIKNYLPHEYIEGGTNATAFYMNSNTDDKTIERTITVTPGTGWICNVEIATTPHYSSTPGEPFTYTTTLQDVTIHGLKIQACDPDNKLSRYVGVTLAWPR